ncbi:MAG: hypothetical protein KM310_04060 [Clostridiales bacterium]|nr:hypothetical protein [Clostridiales bacterium]
MKRSGFALVAVLALFLLGGCQQPLPALPAIPEPMEVLVVAADLTPEEKAVWDRLMKELGSRRGKPLQAEWVPLGTEGADAAVESAVPDETFGPGNLEAIPLDDNPYLLFYRGRLEGVLPSTFEDIPGLSKRLLALPGWDPAFLPALAVPSPPVDLLLAVAFQGEGDVGQAAAALKAWAAAGDIVLRPHPEDDLAQGKVLLAFLPFSEGAPIPGVKARAFPAVPHRYRYLKPLRPPGPEDPLKDLLDFWRDPEVQAYWAWQVGRIPPDPKAFATDVWRTYEEAHPVAAAGREAALRALTLAPRDEAFLREEARRLLSPGEPVSPPTRR